jgi:hypothetical protein
MKPRIKYDIKTGNYICQSEEFKWAGIGSTPEKAYKAFRGSNGLDPSYNLAA